MILFAFLPGAFAQDSESPFVNYDQFETLVKEVRDHRKDKLISIEKFNDMSKEENVIILDTRSKEAYDKMHIKGAIHLNFSDFTQASLDELFGSKDVKILIYCNNNIDEEGMKIEYFPTKMATPVSFDEEIDINKEDRGDIEIEIKEKPITLALNIPTYINLYGYGYKNVYELTDLVSVFDSRIQFEGSEVAN